MRNRIFCLIYDKYGEDVFLEKISNLKLNERVVGCDFDDDRSNDWITALNSH